MDFLLSKDVMWWPSQADSWYQFLKLLSFVSCNPDPLISGESKSPQQGSVRRKKAPQASALAASLYTPLHPLQNSFSQTQVHWRQKIDPILVHIFLLLYFAFLLIVSAFQSTSFKSECLQFARLTRVGPLLHRLDTAPPFRSRCPTCTR